ncbi:acetyltransferase [Alicyclobacillus contaminans]|uniref:N-acetyltransferase n=1 Tax=Alicyclobacillus contaminans TaxID=392016 RepID=UPI0004254B48|nr:N-acetyltransferase [Alicyclobacillus contaminans]GMA50611.1 acetyltransferase [Alicyclobacillus contaminans]
MRIREATVDDVPDMQRVIAQFAAEGLMLPRTEKSLYETLHCFVVAEEDGVFAGTAGLHLLWRDLAEIRSLAVKSDFHGRGVGRMIVQALITKAERLHVPQVLSLTYQTAFFDKLGFQVVQKEMLPHKIWADCIHCKKFHHCDEVAMLYYTAVYAEKQREFTSVSVER